MTLSDDLNFAEQGGAFDEATPAYPVVFGISFTPPIIGVVVGVLGLVGAVSMLFYLVLPTWDTYQQQQSKSTDLQAQITQKTIKVKQVDQIKQELALAQQQKTQVLSLFANEKSLDTLLLDTNRLIESGNAQIPANGVRAKLKRFVPSSDKPEIITDGSLGPLINNKLKRVDINVELQGTFEQTQSIMRNIERLQPLLIVKDFQSKLAPPEPISPSDKNKAVRNAPAQLTTSFQLQALMPLTEKDVAELAKLAKPATKK